MIPTFLYFDTPCVFARSLPVLKSILGSWLGSSPSTGTTTRPYDIVYPLDYLPVANSAQMLLIDQFIDDMSHHLSAKVTKFSIREEWKVSHPDGTPDDVDLYLENVITQTFYYEFYHTTDNFRKVYRESHDGRPPYVIPFVQRRQAKGAAVTAEQHEAAMQKLKVYKDWLLDVVFARGGKEILVVLPIANVEANYRDELSPSPDEQSALDQLFVSPILQAPDIMVPIGEVTYQSKISRRTEVLPVLLNVVGAPNTDFQLLEAVEKVLTLSKRPTSVATGTRMFPSS